MPPLSLISPRLLLSALRLYRRAQQVHATPIEDVYQALLMDRRVATGSEPENIRRTVLFMARILGGLGLDTSCLVRSLVAARLLSDQQGVEMHLAFHEPAGKTTLGHAWVTIHGINVSDNVHQRQTTRQMKPTKTLNMYRAR